MFAMLGRFGSRYFDRESLVDRDRFEFSQQLRKTTIAGDEATHQDVKPRANQSKRHKDKDDDRSPGRGFSFRRNSVLNNLDHRGVSASSHLAASYCFNSKSKSAWRYSSSCSARR